MQRELTTNQCRKIIFKKFEDELKFRYGHDANWKKIDIETIKKYFKPILPITKNYQIWQEKN